MWGEVKEKQELYTRNFPALWYNLLESLLCYCMLPSQTSLQGLNLRLAEN